MGQSGKKMYKRTYCRLLFPLQHVNCRIGSLENSKLLHMTTPDVNCRIGSLEKAITKLLGMLEVNCRIGSLETMHVKEA